MMLIDAAAPYVAGASPQEVRSLVIEWQSNIYTETSSKLTAVIGRGANLNLTAAEEEQHTHTHTNTHTRYCVTIHFHLL